MSGLPSELEDSVRSLFSVKQSFTLPDGELEFQVGYDGSTKGKFAMLKSEASGLGYRPELTGNREECVLTLRKSGTGRKRLSRLPVLLALFTLASLVAVSILQQGVYDQLVPSMSSYTTLLEFGGTVAVLFGAHELAQRVVGRRRDAGHADSYLIPGIPFIPPFLPSLGFATSQREPAVNRDSLFDTVVAGPLAMLGLAVLFYAVGDLVAVRSAVPLQQTMLANATVTIPPNLIQVGLDALFAHPVPAGYANVSPVGDGAIIGFIIVFFAFLPMAFYDGGFLSSIALGSKGARAATYLSVLLLLAVDASYATYWTLAIVVLILAGRPHQLRLLDEVSGLSRSRAIMFGGTIVLAFLCLPIPHDIATLPL